MSEESIKLNGFSEIQRIFSKDNLEISEEEFALLFENSLEDGETTLNIDKFVKDVVENYKLDSGDELYEVISKLAENDGNSETLSLEDLKYEEDAGNEEENKFDESALDKSEWQLVETKSDKVLGFLWNSGTYTYRTSNGTEITVSDTTDVKIYENTKTGEVIVAGAKGAKITGSSSGSNLIIYDSDIESIDTGKASDNIKIYNSSVGNLSTGKGTDSITIEDSEVGKINTGSGNDFVSVADSTVSNVNTSSNFLWGILDNGEDTVILNDTQTEGVKTGRGSDNVLVTNASVNTLDAGGGSNSLSIEETDIENIKTNKNDTIVNDNNYIDIDKDIILGIESDSQIMLEDGTSISVSDYTDYMLSQEVGFETEKEYQEYVLQAMSANLESIKSTFNTQEASDGVVSEGYNLLKELTGLGITNDEIQTLIAEQEAMIEGLTAALNGESSMTFEEAYEYYTGTTYSKEKIDKYMEVSQIYSAVMVGCQYDEDYIEKFEEATGKSIEDISKEYALCQMETFGRSTGIQDLVEKYAEDQNSFADKLSMAISTVGITCIVAGAVVSFVFPPAAPVGIALMTAGKYISLSGMFVDNAMDLVNDSTDSDGLTKEEIGDIALETGVEAVSYMAGRGIGKLTSGVVNPFVTNKAASAGIGKVGQYVLGQTAETTADAALSLGTDFVIAQGQSIITTGQFMDADDYWSMDRLLGEGKNQLIGILTGLSSSKVNAYQQGIISTAQGKILSGDIEGARDYLRSSGMNMSDADFDGFVEQVDSVRAMNAVSDYNSESDLSTVNEVDILIDDIYGNKGIDIQNNGEADVKINVNGKDVTLKTISTEDGKQYIAKEDVVLNNGQIYHIYPVTVSEGNKVGISRLVLPNGIISDVRLDPQYILKLRKLYGRELTNLDILNAPSLKTTGVSRINPEIQDSLKSLQASNPQKYDLVNSVLEKTFIYSKTSQGVSDDYITRFINKLSETDDVLLKNIVDNGIPIEIYDDLILFPNKSHAQYQHGKKPVTSSDGTIETDIFNYPRYVKTIDLSKIILSERYNNGDISVNRIPQDTVESLTHELGHAFDYNNGTKLGLERQDFISVIDGENFERFIDMPSFSKDFDSAITSDIIRMMEIDEQAGRNAGETFQKLLDDPDFGYYLGVSKGQNNNFSFNDVTARKELFAQMVSYVTSGKVTNSNFQSRINELFPNCIDFVSKIMNLESNSYEQNVINTAQGKILSGDIEGARDYLRSSGMNMSDADFDGFVEQVKTVDVETKNATNTYKYNGSSDLTISKFYDVEEAKSYLSSLGTEDAKTVLKSLGKLKPEDVNLDRLNIAIDILNEGETVTLLKGYAKEISEEYSSGTYTVDTMLEIYDVLGVKPDGEFVKDKDGIYHSKSDGLGIITGRAKGNDSVYSKLKNKMLKLGSDLPTSTQEAKPLIGDAQGTRLVLNSIDTISPDAFETSEIIKTEIPEQADRVLFTQYLAGTTEGISPELLTKFESVKNIGLQELSDAQTQTFVDGLSKAIESGEIKITEVHNYYGENSVPYLSQSQLTQIENAYNKWYQETLKTADTPQSSYKLVQETREDGSEIEYLYDVESGVKFYKSLIVETEEKQSGYTAAQFNLVNQYNQLEELQFRGSNLDELAEIEHIVYDIKSNKSTVLGAEYDSVRQVINKLQTLTQKDAAGKTAMDEYNEYFSAVYKSSRVSEFGAKSEEPNIYEDYPLLKELFTEEELYQISKEGLEELHQQIKKSKENE